MQKVQTVYSDLRLRLLTTLLMIASLLFLFTFASYHIFNAFLVLVFTLASLEISHLFKRRYALLNTTIYTIFFAIQVFYTSQIDSSLANWAANVMLYLNSPWYIQLGGLSIWILIPFVLKYGVPDFQSWANRGLEFLYQIALMSFLLAVWTFYLFSRWNEIVLLIGLVALADTGAYFAGKIFGKHKLAPTISPGKSWEGVIGGWVSVVLSLIICALVFPNPEKLFPTLYTLFHPNALLFSATVISVMSVLGDLFESQLKRKAGKKDSGKLLPGHGGILDRIDGMIGVFTVFSILSVLLHSIIQYG